MRKIRIAILRRLYFLYLPFYKHIGKKACIYKPLCVKGRKYISIGERCNISEGARIEAIDQWNEQEFYPEIIIGNNTSIENYLHITSAGRIKVGHDCVLSSRVYITNIDHDYSILHQKVNNQKLIVADVEIGNYCFLGMDVKVFPGVTIGDNVIVGSNSIVMNDLPSNSVCVGIPAKVIKTYNFNDNRWEKVQK